MRGKIKSFIEGKGYGFVLGEDGKDYFLHKKNMIGFPLSGVADGTIVDFEPAANSKGYLAQRCEIIEVAEVGYEMPSQLLTSKSDTVRGWEVLEVSDWIIESVWNKDKNMALRDFKMRASLLGANAILEFRYVQDTESEGNYKYSVFKYVGRLAFVAKKSVNSNVNLKEIQSINSRAKILKIAYDGAYASANRKVGFYWLGAGFVMILSFLNYFISGGRGSFYIAAGINILAIIFGLFLIARQRYQGWWFSKSPVVT